MRNIYAEFCALAPNKQRELLSNIEGRYISVRTLEQEYNDMLDDIYGNVQICGYMYTTSHALTRTDPIAYRCGFSDWLGTSENYIEIQGNYYNTDFVEKELDIIQDID